jgi:hypothetical protein
MIKRHHQGGYIVILNTLIFVVVSTFVTYALAAPLLSSNVAADDILHSKRAFILAGSAVEETFYKLKNQMSVPASDSLTLGDVTATVAVSTDLDGRTIHASSEVENVERNVRMALSESEGVSFHYGLQTGQGGFELYGGALVNGNIYSNGNVVGYGGAQVTGSVTVANASSPVAHISNGSGDTPPNNVIFGGQLVWNDPKPIDMAQSFTVSTTTPVTSVRLYIKKYANVWMNDATVRITNNTSGRPGNTTLASTVLSAAQVTTSYNYLSLPFTSTPTLTPGITYWLVIDTENTWNSYYLVGANPNGYAGGQVKTGTYGSGTWSDTSPSGLDMYFDLYVGGQTGSISGQQNDRLTIGGDAWARNISGANVTGTMYCQSSSYTNKTCDTSRPDPVQQPFPVSDGNIEAWKLEAEAGGSQTGNVSVGWQGLTLGPRKIVGNLTVSGGGVLTVTGTLWVTGNISVSGGGTVRLADAYGNQSGIIVTDGRISATGGGTFVGNNVAGNYILLITTSTCPTGSCSSNPAVTVSGGAGAVILNAQKGTLRMTGGAEAKQLTAEKIIMDGGTEVHYESGLMDMNFTSGPSGSWSVSDWSEI